MTGANYNKKLKKYIKKYKSGQVLLITIMLIAVVLTVVLSITFTSRTETQLTKLEEENQKALAAAEAGIEAALKTGATVAIDPSSLNVPQGFTGSATVTESTGNEFVSPSLLDGQQYSFYLSSYTVNNGRPVFSSPYNGTLTLHYGTANSQNCNNVALEITIVSGSNPPYIINRWKADTGTSLGSTVGEIGQVGSSLVDGVNFACSTSSISVPVNSLFMLVRVIGKDNSFYGTRLGFRGTSLKSQGKYIVSEARSPSGVTKKVQLFQSYSQIPADFWVTSF